MHSKIILIKDNISNIINKTMAKVLLINPNKWGRGITPIWIASHAATLRDKSHNVELFDSTFYSGWTNMEVDYNTENAQYRPTEYSKYVEYSEVEIEKDLL